MAEVYVDDIILTGTNSEEICALKHHLDNFFSIKDLGCLTFFLGMEVAYVSDGLILTQTKFTKELLQDSQMGAIQPQLLSRSISNFTLIRVTCVMIPVLIGLWLVS